MRRRGTFWGGERGARVYKIAQQGHKYCLNYPTKSKARNLTLKIKTQTREVRPRIFPTRRQRKTKYNKTRYNPSLKDQMLLLPYPALSSNLDCTFTTPLQQGPCHSLFKPPHVHNLSFTLLASGLFLGSKLSIGANICTVNG